MLYAFRQKGKRLYLFRPVEDLSLLSEESLGAPALAGWGKQPVRPMAADLEKYVIKVCWCTLKVFDCEWFLNIFRWD